MVQDGATAAMGYGTSLNVCRSISRTRSTPTMVRLTGYPSTCSWLTAPVQRHAARNRASKHLVVNCDLQAMLKPTGQTASNGYEDQFDSSRVERDGAQSWRLEVCAAWRQKGPREESATLAQCGNLAHRAAGRHGAQRLSWFRSPPASDCACTYLLRHEHTLHRLRRHSATRACLVQLSIDIDR